MKYVFDRNLCPLFIHAGVDVQRLLADSHLPADLFGRKDILLSKDEYLRLMHSAGQQARDDTALRIATSEGIETYSPPIFAAYCSSNAENFLSRFAHYKRLVGPLRFVLTQHTGRDDTPDGDGLEVEICGVDKDDALPAFWVEIEMAFLVHLIRKATQADVTPLAVTIAHRSMGRALRDFLGCSVKRGQRNSLLFAMSDMRRPFRSRNDAMWQYIEPELRRRLSEMEIDDTVAARVRSALVELLPVGKSTVCDVAEKLCLSRRTLQRKLADERTTFQQQLNSTRLLLARHYLANSDRTSDDIAFLLGYADTTSFLRAFNVWTGLTVTEYRRMKQ